MTDFASDLESLDIRLDKKSEEDTWDDFHRTMPEAARYMRMLERLEYNTRSYMTGAHAHGEMIRESLAEIQAFKDQMHKPEVHSELQTFALATELDVGSPAPIEREIPILETPIQPEWVRNPYFHPGNPGGGGGTPYNGFPPVI